MFEDVTTDQLISELRSRVPLVIVWVEADLPEGVDPDLFDWGTVEDRCISVGNDTIDILGQ